MVKSIDETIKYYEKVFAFGPFEIRQVDYPNATYYGEIAGYRGKRAFFYLGPIQIELIDGKTIHEAFLKEKGEGVHHIAFEVNNLEESKRVKILQVLANATESMDLEQIADSIGDKVKSIGKYQAGLIRQN